MPSKREKQALRKAQQRKNQLITNLAIGLGVIAVIAIIVVIVISTNSAPIPKNGLTMGDPNAPIKITEFADFQCPACAYFVQNTKPELVEKYIATGKVSFSFAPYSFIGPESFDAAAAAFCAADQNKFWDYYQYLFTHQGAAENDGSFSPANLKEFALQLGLDSALFNECLDSGKYTQAVLDSNALAESYQLTGTPSFIVNGKVVGSQSGLLPTIEELLSEQ